MMLFMFPLESDFGVWNWNYKKGTIGSYVLKYRKISARARMELLNVDIVILCYLCQLSFFVLLFLGSLAFLFLSCFWFLYLWLWLYFNDNWLFLFDRFRLNFWFSLFFDL